MKRKIIIGIIITILIITSIVIYIIMNNRTVSYIILDINPSIRINLNNKNKVKKVIALNKDANKIIDNVLDKDLDNTLENITKNIINSEYIDERRTVDLLLYVNGKIPSDEVKNKIINILDKEKYTFDIKVIKKINKEDIKLASKYNISYSKAAYINSIIKNKKNINSKYLVNKSINELNNTKNTGYYCMEDYILDGTSCIKEIKRDKAPNGDICPNGYGMYNGTCYEEIMGEESDKLICRDDFNLVADKCERHSEHEAIGKCTSGDYDRSIDKCVERKYVKDAVEYCRITPGEDLLYNGRCLGRKPTINGGCLDNDVVIDGWCYDTSPTSGYEAEWMCNIDGKIELMNKSNSDGKCYKEEITNPVSYYCDDNSKVVDKKCISDDIEDAIHEIICPSGYTKLNDRCYNLNKKTNTEKGLYCDGADTRLVGKECVYYERIEANKS